MRLIVYAIVAAVALQRLGEVWLSARNTAALKARGAVEIGAGHYPVMIALHVSWLATLVLAVPNPPAIYALPLGVFIALQLARICIIASLGEYWTTRIITLPGAPLSRKGPYRILRHPNYWLVAGEIASLPLAFGEWQVALVYTILNAMMLAWRIRVEDAALAARRAL